MHFKVTIAAWLLAILFISQTVSIHAFVHYKNTYKIVFHAYLYKVYTSCFIPTGQQLRAFDKCNIIICVLLDTAIALL